MVKVAEFLHQLRLTQKGPEQEHRDSSIDVVVDGTYGRVVRSDLRSSCGPLRSEGVLLPLVHGGAMPCVLAYGH